MNKNIWVPIVVVAIFSGFIGGHFLEKYLGHQEKTSLSVLTASMAKAASEPSSDEDNDTGDNKEEQQDTAPAEPEEQQQAEQPQQQLPTLQDLVKISFKSWMGGTPQYPIEQRRLDFVSKVDGLTISSIKVNNGSCGSRVDRNSSTFNQGVVFNIPVYCDALNIINVTLETNYGTITGNVDFQ